MPGAAARDQRDLRLVPIGADDDLDMRIAVEARQTTARGAQHAVDGFGDQRFLGVHELLHGLFLLR